MRVPLFAQVCLAAELDSRSNPLQTEQALGLTSALLARAADVTERAVYKAPFGPTSRNNSASLMDPGIVTWIFLGGRRASARGSRTSFRRALHLPGGRW